MANFRSVTCHIVILSLQVRSTFNCLSFLITILIKNLYLQGSEAVWLGQYNPPYLPDFLDCLIILKMKILRSFETSQNVYPIAQRQLTRDLNLHQHLWETLSYSTKCLKWNATDIKLQNISLNSAILEFRPLLLEFNILSHTIKLIPIFVLILTFSTSVT